MECKITDCSLYKDCGILEITHKIPANKHACSYFRTAKDDEKTKKRLEIPEKKPKNTEKITKKPKIIENIQENLPNNQEIIQNNLKNTNILTKEPNNLKKFLL